MHVVKIHNIPCVSGDGTVFSLILIQGKYHLSKESLIKYGDQYLGETKGIFHINQFLSPYSGISGEELKTLRGNISGKKKKKRSTQQRRCSILGYHIEIEVGLLNVKSGSSFIRELFLRLKKPPYWRRKWIPGVFIRIRYEVFHYIALGLTPAVIKNSNTNTDLWEPRISYLDWSKL